MNNFDDTTGMQNPIFKIMGSQTNASNNNLQDQMGQNNFQNINMNSMQQGQMDQSGMGQMNMQNPMNLQMGQLDMNMK